jgi:SAM-dependent methyltransferase
MFISKKTNAYAKVILIVNGRVNGDNMAVGIVDSGTDMMVQGTRKYPVTDLVKAKPFVTYNGRGPYGEFGSEKDLINYLERLDDGKLRRQSDLYRVMTSRFGGWLFTDRLYEDRPRTELDEAIYNTRSCRSVHDRKHLVREQLLKLMREGSGRFSLEDPMQIYDLGSGPSDYTVEAFAKYGMHNGRGLPAHATCIDIDPAAISRGRDLAKAAGVERHVDFKISNIGKMLREGIIKDVDLMMAIGVICPLEDGTVMKLFTRSRDSLEEGGHFYTCAMRHHPLEGVLKRAGWNLNHREPEKVEKMMKDAGFGNIEIYLTPEELFVMALGQKG